MCIMLSSCVPTLHVEQYEYLAGEERRRHQIARAMCTWCVLYTWCLCTVCTVGIIIIMHEARFLYGRCGELSALGCFREAGTWNKWSVAGGNATWRDVLTPPNGL